MPVVPGSLLGWIGTALPVGPVEEPQALAVLPDGGKQVFDAGAADFVEPGLAPAPLACVCAVPQAQAGVIEGLGAAVLALGEQAGGCLEAAIAQQHDDPARPLCVPVQDHPLHHPRTSAGSVS